ncbi:MAG: hypothetical protein JXR63_06480 [Spirochaetales bacterium]|nr:hypothetical protein [Spirochaetales bacterium]
MEKESAILEKEVEAVDNGGVKVDESSVDSKKKKKRKNRVELSLVHPETNDEILIHAPKMLKMSFKQSLLELYFGIPSLDVKPIDKLGTAELLVPFLYYVTIAGVSQNILFTITGFFLLAFNFIITKNYFIDYVSDKVSKGYLGKSDDDKAYLASNGVAEVSRDKVLRSKMTKWIIFGGLVLISAITLFF